jgi:hypothetical protein
MNSQTNKETTTQQSKTDQQGKVEVVLNWYQVYQRQIEGNNSRWDNPAAVHK